MYLRNLGVFNIDLDDTRSIDYKMNFKVINVLINDDYSFKKENIDFMYDEVNGFTRVLMKDGKFALYDVVNDKFSAFTYDVVTDFNDFGYAMVGRYGGVTWIDRNFNVIDREGKLSLDNGENINNKNSFTSVHAFSNGKSPLSKVTVIGDEIFSSFVNTDLEIQKFYDSFDSDSKKKEKYISKFDYIDAFVGDYNFMKDKSKVLLSNGHFISFNQFVRCAENFGVFDSLYKEANIRKKK